MCTMWTAFTRGAGKYRVTVVLGGDVIDQLLDQNGLADTGAAEQADLTALGVGADQVHDLDAGLKDLGGGLLLLVAGSGTVDGPVGIRGGVYAAKACTECHDLLFSGDF